MDYTSFYGGPKGFKGDSIEEINLTSAGVLSFKIHSDANNNDTTISFSDNPIRWIEQKLTISYNTTTQLYEMFIKYNTDTNATNLGALNGIVMSGAQPSTPPAGTIWLKLEDA